MTPKIKQLPEGWKEVELGEVIKLKGGFAFKSKDFMSKGIPLVRISNFNNNEVDLKNSVFIQEKIFLEFPELHLRENDLLIAMSGATTGKVGIVSKDNLPCLLNQRVGKFEVRESKLDWRYLFLFIKSNQFQDKVFSIAGGCAQPNISGKQIESIKIPLPPLPVQNQIVSILEKAESLKRKREEADKLTKEYLQSVFYEMFYNKGFEEIELGDKKICEISGEYGSGAGAREYDRKIRYIRITDINEDGTLRQELVSPSIIEKKYFLRKGDLLFARTGATVGKTYLHNSNKENYQYAGYLIRFRFNNKIVPEYVYFSTQTPKYTGWVSSMQKVVAQPNINAKQYSSLKIPLPPLPLQQKFASIVEQVEKLKEKQKQSEEKINEMFNSLMQKAFNGELVK